ncbi:MAG: hypothetical protein R3E58_08005 [Phycisphaerae bacterium]
MRRLAKEQLGPAPRAGFFATTPSGAMKDERVRKAVDARGLLDETFIPDLMKYVRLTERLNQQSTGFDLLEGTGHHLPDLFMDGVSIATGSTIITLRG